MERPPTAFSAPGKVLLVGGYLVLERAFTGLVFGLDARVHVHVETLPTSSGVKLSEVVVKSPQFQDAEWRYGYRETENNGGIEVTQLKGHSTAHQSRNKFVETALAYALTYASSLNHSKIGSASITILADSDYYSHAGSSDGDIPSKTERFVDFNVPLHEAHKTGLGSSAALVTALIAATMAHYVPKELIEVTSRDGRLRLHNLAQAAHCAAQGKIGSGFDVAAAVYGSCVYRRFSPSILGGLGDVGSEGFAGRLEAAVDDSNLSKKWDTEINKASAILPKGLRLLMCDVDCGSETVGMVKNVIAWKIEQPEQAKTLWAVLQKRNEELVDEFNFLQSGLEGAPSNFEKVRSIMLTIRTKLREMSKNARVPIEPKVQTDLIDSCCRLNGVIGGIVPGAGGYDAIALLVEDGGDVIKSLNRHLQNHRVEVDSSQGPRISQVRLLGVKQDDQGVKQEAPFDYSEWIRNPVWSVPD